MKPTELLFLAALIILAPYATPKQAGFWGVVLFILALITWWME